jgi:excisionase family DNA binding protein
MEKWAMSENLTIAEIMRILHVSRTSAYGYSRSGRLKSYKIGRLVRVKTKDLKRFVERSGSTK